MSYLLYLPEIEGLHILEVKEEEMGWVIIAESLRTEQACPSCGKISQRIQSHYQRRPQALPSLGLRVRNCLCTKRFRGQIQTVHAQALRNAFRI